MNEKILVVDDERELADLLEVYLKNDVYTVYKYYNGRDALKGIEENTPDLAILDVMLPDNLLRNAVLYSYTDTEIAITEETRAEEQINKTPVFDTMKVHKSRRFYFYRQKSEGQTVWNGKEYRH